MKKILLGALMMAGLTQIAIATEKEVLSPAESNPVNLKTMTGFPPSSDGQVTWANMLRFPQMRWSFHNIRELVPTANIWKGQAGNISELESVPYPVADISFMGPDDQQHTVKEWLKDTYTDGFIVLHNGDVAYEYYTDGMKPHYPHLMMSTTKSVIGLLASNLIARGKLDPSALVTDYIPELAESAWSDATVQQTLDMTTGIHFVEEYSNPKSDIYRYAFAGGFAPAPKGYDGPMGMYSYLPTLKKQGEHGEQFTYRTVNPEVANWIVQRVAGENYNQLVSEVIWRPMGAQFNANIMVDSHGTALAGGGMNATLRDLARFGEMIRNHGRYNSTTIIEPKAIEDLFQDSYEVKLPEDHYSGGRKGYSYHNFWWLTNNDDRAIEAWGIHGQIIHINPTDDVVIVKLSSRPGAGNSPYTEMATRAFGAIGDALAAEK